VRSISPVILPITITENKVTLTGDSMLNLILAACAAFGAACGAEIPKDWETVYRICGEAAVTREPDWITPPAGTRVSGAVFVSPTIQWSVPNQVLPGSPQFPFPPSYHFPQYDPGTNPYRYP
jgi:hypothetical protein